MQKTQETVNKAILSDQDCLSARIIGPLNYGVMDVYFHSPALLTSSIFHKINAETNESKVLSSLQREAFTADSLKDFIRKVWSLKNDRNLPDDTAMNALSLLLPDVASRWWEDTRPFVKNWNLAVALILKVLDSRRTLQDAWREFESCNHQYDRHLSSFLMEQRVLLAEIRQSNIILSEQTQIDLIYYKLNSSLRKRIEREKITSFNELMKQAEMCGLTEFDPEREDPNEICKSCQQPGHDSKLCFGSVYESELVKQKPRYVSSDIPYIAIKLNGIPDYVHLSTDSHVNVISDSMYTKLVHRGCAFETTKQIVASSITEKLNVLKLATVIVECNHRLVSTPIVKLQSSRGNKNCFSLNFIEACDLLPYLSK